jgi:uncharacterized protein GlcG (DUF336 family)
MSRARIALPLLAFALLVPSAGPAAAQKGAVASLGSADVTRVLDQAEAAAKQEESLLRVDAAGKKQKTRMHIMVVDRSGKVVGRRSMADAWVGSIAIAKSKAFTALAFSSNENALTSRSLGALTQPGGPLWNIGNSNRDVGLIEFPGGVPLYKGNELVGAVGVSGDGVDQDEHVALAGAKGFDAPAHVRVDTVTKNGVPYIK